MKRNIWKNYKEANTKNLEKLKEFSELLNTRNSPSIYQEDKEKYVIWIKDMIERWLEISYKKTSRIWILQKNWRENRSETVKSVQNLKSVRKFFIGQC